MSPWILTVVGAAVAGYAALSRRLSSTVVSGPLVFVAIGLAIGPLGLDLADLKRDPHLERTLLETALSLVLFTDGAAIRHRDLRREAFLPLRLLAVGLPLTMALGWLTAWPLLPGLSVWELALVGVILAPTDAALGQQAVSDRRVPALVRHGLSVESGLNDGLSLPFFVLALAAAGSGHTGRPGVGETFLRALLLSSVLGLGTGWLLARLLRWSELRGWITDAWRQLFTVAVPVVAYGLSRVVDGSGFIAVWVAGLAFGHCLRAQTGADAAEAPTSPLDFAEHLSVLLTSISFLVFGALILGPTLQHLSWRMVVYSVLSLTVLRMLPVALSLVGARLRPQTVLYTGWFGPRGLASLVFGLIALEENLPGMGLLGATVAVTVGLSVLLHGVSAPLLGARYGAWYQRTHGQAPDLREGAPPPERRA